MAYKITRGVEIPKAKIHPNPWNPNRMSTRAKEAINESLSEYGQVIEILVRPHPEIIGEYEIIDGEHRYEALPKMVFCNIIDGIEDNHAKKLTVVMNETRGDADQSLLAELLDSISVDFGSDLQTALPWDDEELKSLLEKTESFYSQDDYDGGNEPQDSSTKEIDVEEYDFEHKCPKCGFEYND